MAETGAAAPASGEAVDRRGWSSSWVITGGFIVVMGLLFWFGSGVWDGPLHSLQYADMGQITAAGHAIWSGNLRDVYRASQANLALPLSFFLMAPLSPVIAGLGQPTPGHDVATLLTGSYLLAYGAFLLHAVRTLAWSAGVRRRLWLLQILAAVVVLLPEFEFGHFEDVLALAAVIYALTQVLRGGFIPAALWLSVAISFKQWAMMLALLVIVMAPRGTRVKTAVVASLLPAALGVASLALDGAFAYTAFFSPAEGNPVSGHPGIDPTSLGFGSPEASRVTALLIAAGVGLRLRRVARPEHLLGVAALILVIRPLSEPANYSYYWSPSMLLVLLAGTVALGRVRGIVAIWPVLAVIWAIPMGLQSSVAGWWACQLVVIGTGGFLVWRALRLPASVTPVSGPEPTPSECLAPFGRQASPLTPTPVRSASGSLS